VKKQKQKKEEKRRRRKKGKLLCEFIFDIETTKKKVSTLPFIIERGSW